MLYLDTSFVAPLVLNEDVSPQVEAFLAKQAAGSLAVSQWTRVEFCSLVAREVRMNLKTAVENAWHEKRLCRPSVTRAPSNCRAVACHVAIQALSVQLRFLVSYDFTLYRF